MDKLLPESGRVLDVLFVVDVSSAVDRKQFTVFIKLMQKVVAEMNIDVAGSRVGVILFGSHSQLLIELGTYKHKYDIMHALATLQLTLIGGSPDILAALLMAQLHLQNIPALNITQERVVFLIVNAHPVEDEVLDEALTLRLQGIKVVCDTFVFVVVFFL